MPSRTLSNSSDVSVASSNNSPIDDLTEIAGSGRNTPTPTGHLRGGEWNREFEDGIIGMKQARGKLVSEQV